MIDPEKVTEYDQRTNRLEEFILFWVCAAGKNGRTAARCLDKLLYALDITRTMSPFAAIRATKANLPQLMKKCGIGCYNSKAKSFRQLANTGLNLRTCTVDDLESIHGIGMKTSRCFIMHSRKNAQVAGIDTHLLKHLRAKGIKDVPKSTPGSKKQYLRLEKEILRLAKEANMAPADYDLMVWNKYSVKSTSKKVT
jgi:thermostable 8-oxoguanine DNA glycosylase